MTTQVDPQVEYRNASTTTWPRYADNEMERRRDPAGPVGASNSVSVKSCARTRAGNAAPSNPDAEGVFTGELFEPLDPLAGERVVGRSSITASVNATTRTVTREMRTILARGLTAFRGYGFIDVCPGG